MDRETLFGRILGVVAIIAIIVEMVLAGISAESVTTAIKDIAETVVSVNKKCPKGEMLLF